MTHNLSGTYGHWTILGRAAHKSKKTAWRCRCTCGKTKDVTTHSLVHGTSTNCGCKRQASLLASNCLRPYEALYNGMLRCAAKAGHDVELSFEEFLGLTTDTKCHYCSCEIKWASVSPQKNGGIKYQLDRKNNSLGYTKSNVVVCCTMCNIAKGNRYSYNEWLAMATALKGIRNGRTDSNNRSAAATGF